MKISEHDWGLGSFFNHLLAWFLLPVVLLLWPFIALFVKWKVKRQVETVQIN